MVPAQVHDHLGSHRIDPLPGGGVILDPEASAPEVLEPVRRQLGVANRVLDVLVTEITLQCAPCHDSSGAGVSMLFPRLATAPLVQATDPTSLIRVVLIGIRVGATAAAPTAPAMPRFDWNLSDREIADVLTYVRNAWATRRSRFKPQMLPSCGIGCSARRAVGKRQTRSAINR